MTSDETPSANRNDFCFYKLHTTGWEYDLYYACGDKPIRLFSVNERQTCKRCGRKMMFIPEPIKPAWQLLVGRLRNEGAGFASDHALEAADTIEALAKERDEALRAASNSDAEANHWHDNCIAEQRGPDGYPVFWQWRAEAAEAEVVRLRELRLGQIAYSVDLQRIIETLCRGGELREPETTARFHWNMAKQKLEGRDE